MTVAERPLVDGETRLYCIVGDPIAQVGAPKLYTARFRAAGLNAVLVPFHVPVASFDEAMRGILALKNLDGIVITVPYKARVLAYVDRLQPSGRLVGAVNTMRRDADGRWSGDMFDGIGLVRGLQQQGHAVDGRQVMLIGAGGAGSAVAFALAQARAAAITLFDIEPSKAEDLAARVRAAYPQCRAKVGRPAAEGYDILINVSPVGMAPGDGLPAPLGRLDQKLLVIDAVMKPEVTPLIRHAQAHGCATVGGRHMLEGQADEVMRFWLPT